MAELDARYAAVRTALESWRAAGRDQAEIAALERAFARAWRGMRHKADALRRPAA